MKIILSLLFILSALGARADLAIYAFTGTQAVTGGGTEYTLRVTGLLLIDMQTGQATRIVKFRANGVKQFSAGDESNFAVWRAQGRATTTALVLSSSVTDTGGTYLENQTFYSGKDTLVNLGPRWVTLPRTVKGSGYVLVDTGAPFLAAMSIQTLTHTFSARESALANNRGETIATAVHRHSELLRAQGYQ